MKNGQGVKALLRMLLEPQAVRRRAAKSLLGRIGRLPYSTKIRFETMAYPQYAYGTYYAAAQAGALGLDEISVIEFGVAGGNGLLALEDAAANVERSTGVRIRCFGFDLGQGMPESVDYRDLPYVWKQGIFKMDHERLLSRLDRAELILGDVAQTIPTFAADESTPPVGFISFDLDYYSSTKSAFALLGMDDKRFLPRTFCYFDDCIGDDWELHSEFTGELLLINEYNRDSRLRKLGRIHGLRHKTVFDSRWHDVMYVLHSFEHPDYNTYINPRGDDWQLALTD